MMSTFDYLLKLIVIGDSGVGKSCLVQQFTDMTTRSSHDITIGVQFAAKSIQIDKKLIKLQIWDTAGQENFRSITRSYYRNAVGAFLVYDVTRRETFLHVKNWLQEVKANSNTLQILLVANKIDMESQRKVSFQEGNDLAISQGLKFIETTAKEYKIVEKAFQTLVKTIINKIHTNQLSIDTPGLKVSHDCKVKVKKSKSTCC